MRIHEITVHGRSISANSQDVSVVRTSIGTDSIHVLFDDAEWLEFPVTVTFGNGSTLVSLPCFLEGVPDSDDWAAETEVTIPCEVTGDLGPIRVTLQGTDSSGRHIITAKGSPLSVEEAGDVAIGDMPAEPESVDEWSQVYADIVSVIEEMREAYGSITGSVDAIADAVMQRIGELPYPDIPAATRLTIGGVIIGDGLSVDQDGRLSTDAVDIASLSGVGVVMPDGTSTVVDELGVIHARSTYVLPRANETRLGGVVVGGGLRTDDTGVISVLTMSESDITEVTPFQNDYSGLIDADILEF